MTREEYIQQHPELFNDNLDKWLYKELGIMRGCCFSKELAEYITAREVGEKLQQAMIDKACEWIKENAGDYVVHHWNETMLDTMSLIHDFVNYMKGD